MPSEESRGRTLQNFGRKLYEDRFWGLLIIAASNIGGVIALLSVRHWGYNPDMLLWTSAGQGVGFCALALLVLLRGGKP